MTASERWQEIDRIFDAALEREPGARSAFLDEGCGDDKQLRAEVESLLAHSQRVCSGVTESNEPPAC
jgi:hypothetical protein